MCKATNKANAYSITKDAKTKAFNISFNGVYSNEIRNLMHDHNFRWSKSNACYYGWTKDILSLSTKIQKLVFSWRNENNKSKFIECPLILESDIKTVDIYKNKKEYVMASKVKDNFIKVSIDELDSVEEENNIKEESVKTWYQSTYKDDTLADEIKDNVTFNDIKQLLLAGDGEHFYDLVGDGIDSLIRERIFAKLAELNSVKYEDIYNAWLGNSEKLKKTITNRAELDSTIEEVKQRWLTFYWDSPLETWEDFEKCIDDVVDGIINSCDLSQYKESQYSIEQGLSKEQLKQHVLYSCYDPKETAKHVKVTKLVNEEYRRGVNFCNLKCCSLSEAMKYIEEDKNKFDPASHVMAIQAYIDFDSELEYEKFVRFGLMVDQSWLSEDNHFGGAAYCYLETLETFDHDTNSELSHKVYYMKPEERKAKGIGFMTAGVIVRVNGIEKIAIDPEGFEYARYVGVLPEEEVIYTAPESDFWLSEEEQELLLQAKRDGSFSIIDFGARRSTNENFWNELKKLGKVKIDSNMWSFERVAA